MAVDWTEGYVTDISYTFGYYPELNPLRVKLAFLDEGVISPEFGKACELGFGQGLGVNLNASASITEWYGTDFNPAHAAFARELAAVSGSGAKLYNDSFADFANRTDLPDFDYIGLHGIWSWISQENQSIIVDFIRRKLAVGGVVYISYNTMPGWAAFVPMQDFLLQHSAVMGVSGENRASRFDSALAFTERLMALNSLYFKANPSVTEQMQRLKEKNRNDLVHEYCNHNWHPISFAMATESLAPAKLEYACSANYLDHIDTVNMTQEQQAFLREIPDPTFRQSVRDVIVNQHFRKDYWVKGVRRLSPFERAEALRQQQVILISHRSDVSLKVVCALGEATFSDAVYNPVLNALADHKPKSLGEIERVVKEKGITLEQVTRSVIALSGAGHIASVHIDDTVIDKAKKHTDKLNGYLINKARGSGDVNYLASPVTGGGVSVGRFQQLFLLALSQGKKTAADQAWLVWQILAGQGQKIVKDSRTLESVEENLAELTELASVFAAKQLPILKALLVV